MLWTEELFHVKKPIIAMLHLEPLPGDPLFSRGTNMQQIADLAKRDLEALQRGGVDGVRGFAAVAAQVTGVDRALPQGEAIVRAGEWNGQQYLTVAFEYGGRLRCPLGAIRVTLPADMGATYTIVGAQNALDTVSADGTVSFELPRSAFSAGELPVALLTVSAQ